MSDGTPVSSGSRHVMYGKPFVDLKTPLDALKVIYEGESEFDMLVFLPTATALTHEEKENFASI